MIEVRNLSKYFGEKQVLSNINVTFHKGITNLVIGQSGSGKTVLLKCLVGLLIPEEGQILYEGVDFISLSEKEKREIRKTIGMLFQGSALFDSMTVEENIRFPLDLFTQMTETEKKERVNFCLQRVNLHNVNKLYPAELSGGMQKRVGIARAIALNPLYLFCDEPNSGLDPKTAILIDELIREITEEYGITTIINTHDMNSVMRLGKNIIFLTEGKIAWQGNNQQILDAENEKLKDFVFANTLLQRKP
ncbi:MAG: ATP-binding cassette domain-containing protein [Bacteroidales bacterium]|nr:ATP-binding cassette domain-containing protein [Bacteroidales bacterium]